VLQSHRLTLMLWGSHLTVAFSCKSCYSLVLLFLIPSTGIAWSSTVLTHIAFWSHFEKYELVSMQIGIDIVTQGMPHFQ